MAEMITEENNPQLWVPLHGAYLTQRKPGHVLRGRKMYRVHESDEQKIMFEEINTVNYIDSRSWKRTKKATYRKLLGN